MADNKDEAIALSWDIHNDDEISTPRLLQMVADDNDCDIGDVIDAMVRVGRFEPADAVEVSRG